MISVAISLHTKEYTALVEFLIQIRKSAGVSQVSLGLSLGKPQSYISKVERCERRIDLIEFIAWVQAVGLDPVRALSDFIARLEAST